MNKELEFKIRQKDLELEINYLRSLMQTELLKMENIKYIVEKNKKITRNNLLKFILETVILIPTIYFFGPITWIILELILTLINKKNYDNSLLKISNSICKIDLIEKTKKIKKIENKINLCNTRLNESIKYQNKIFENRKKTKNPNPILDEEETKSYIKKKSI